MIAGIGTIKVAVSPRYAWKLIISAGMVTSAARQDTAVKLTDKATLALAKWLYKFAIEPAGQAATSSIPFSTEGLRPRDRTRTRAISGKKTNWPAVAAATSLGLLITRRKSSTVKPRPTATIVRITRAGTAMSTTGLSIRLPRV